MRPEERLFAAIGEAGEDLLERSERMGRRGGRLGGRALRAALIAAACAALLLSGALAGRKILRIFAQQNEGVAEEYWADGYVSSGAEGDGIGHAVITRRDHGLRASFTLDNGVDVWIAALTPSQRERRAERADLWQGKAAFTALDAEAVLIRADRDDRSGGGWATGFGGVSLPAGVDGGPGEFVSIEVVELPDGVSTVDFGIRWDGGLYDSILSASQGDLVIFALPDFTDGYDIVMTAWGDTPAPGETAEAVLRIGVTETNPIAE